MYASPARVPFEPMAANLGRVGGRAFARLDVYARFDDAAAAWAEIAAIAAASPYQSLAFTRAWAQTVGASEGATPIIVVARDDLGRVTALLPLGVSRRGVLTTAALLGGRFANYQMGLFRADAGWSRPSVEALLREAARKASPAIDLFVFVNLPLEWGGALNPLTSLPHQPGPSDAFATALPASHEAWLKTRFSPSALKKFRRKLRKLEALGPVCAIRVSDAREVRQTLALFLRQKAERARIVGARAEFEQAPTIALLEQLSGLGPQTAATPPLEWHALRVGARIVAVFGGLADRRRLHGLILSFDATPDVAFASPGEQLVIEVVRDAISRGLGEFDLGVGEARYKNECCERTEPLHDVAFAATRLGWLARIGFLAWRRAKRHVKRSPRWLSLALKLQRRIGKWRAKPVAGP